MKIELTIARNSINELTSIEIQLYLHELRNRLREQYPGADIDIDMGLQSICHNSLDDDSINEHVARVAQQTFNGDSWWPPIFRFDHRTYFVAGEATLSDRVFAGSRHGAADGEQYWAEYQLDVVDLQDNSHTAYVRFPAVRGQEPPEDEYPWDDIDQYVVAVTEDLT